jgi:hypothetical protein
MKNQPYMNLLFVLCKVKNKSVSLILSSGVARNLAHIGGISATLGRHYTLSLNWRKIIKILIFGSF